jgi:hypothetical protein
MVVTWLFLVPALMILLRGRRGRFKDRLFNGRMAFEAKALLKYANSCGTYPGKLQASPETHRRIDSKTVRGDTVWTIQPPPVTVSDVPDVPDEPVPRAEEGSDDLPRPPLMPALVG